jgi:hypothetical protein
MIAAVGPEWVASFSSASMRLLRACLLLSLLLSGCGSDPTGEDTLLGTWELVSIDSQPLPHVTVDITRLVNGATQSAKYEVLSARMILGENGWREERSGRATQNGVVSFETSSDAGTWEQVGNEVFFYNVRGYADGAASIVGDALSMIRHAPIDRGKYFLYRR